MGHMHRVASILGTLLVGVSAYLMVSGRRANNRARRGEHQPVEELAEELKEAWSAYHQR